ncbi:MAG TPA: branched-chain amino acid ABC transporter permease [Anaerovoracaceae bacterium]|nr:branched-chain amino acid ABC transporter permease [Anaerovoracaceae bacterium]
MKKKVSLGILVLLAIFLPIFVKQTYVIQMLIMVLLYTYWASSWNIIGGLAGQFSLGHGAYIGIGAYVSTVLWIQSGVSPWIGMMIGGLISGLVSLIIGLPTFRLRGSYFTLATIALLFAIQIFFTTESTIFGYHTGGAMGLKVPWEGTVGAMQFMDKMWYYYLILAMLIIAVLITKWIISSKTGYYLAAINTNQEAADSLGVNITYYKMKAQFISAFLTAAGGTFYAQLVLFIDPTRIFGYDLSVQFVFLAVIGGMGSLWGPVIGALLLSPLSSLLNSYLGSQMAGLSIIVYGLVMMLIVYYMPSGIHKHVIRLFDWMLGEGKSKKVAGG